jgi:hypothetical protein
MSETNRDVHTSRSVQSGVKTLNVIGSDKNEPAGKEQGRLAKPRAGMKTVNAPAFRGIQTGQEATQAYGTTVSVRRRVSSRRDAMGECGVQILQQ